MPKITWSLRRLSGRGIFAGAMDQIGGDHGWLEKTRKVMTKQWRPKKVKRKQKVHRRPVDWSRRQRSPTAKVKMMVMERLHTYRDL